MEERVKSWKDFGHSGSQIFGTENQREVVIWEGQVEPGEYIDLISSSGDLMWPVSMKALGTIAVDTEGL